MNATHTPTPWRFERCTLGHPDNANNPIISSASGNIARLFYAKAMPGCTSHAPESLEEAEANAALIVRAVNSHEALVAACEAILKYRDDAGPLGFQLEKADYFFDAARAALALAKPAS